MTMREFVRKLRDLAQEQDRHVFAIDFEPTPDGIKLTIRFEAMP